MKNPGIPEKPRSLSWLDRVLLILLLISMVVLYLRVELYSSWLTSHGEEIIRIQSDIKGVLKETAYNRVKSKTLEFEISRVIQQNQAFEEAYNNLLEERKREQ